jgi:hypothetical protein
MIKKLKENAASLLLLFTLTGSVLTGVTVLANSLILTAWKQGSYSTKKLRKKEN